MQPRPRTIGILLFDDVEVLDFAGPFEVFSVAVPEGEWDDEARLFRAVLIAEEMRTIQGRGGFPVVPHHTIADHPPLDILIVPGGWGTRRERLNQRLIAWIAAVDRHTEITASVCTGSLLLGECGLLNGKSATTHWRAISLMRELYPRVTMLEDIRFVDQGHIVTSAGISAGIDMSLHIVERLCGPSVADWAAKRMEYERPPLSPG